MPDQSGKTPPRIAAPYDIDLTDHEWSDLIDFDPNHLLDGLIAKMRLENDAALASQLQVIQPIIRMIRDGSLTMSPAMLMGWIKEATGITSAELRQLIRQPPAAPNR